MKITRVCIISHQNVLVIESFACACEIDAAFSMKPLLWGSLGIGGQAWPGNKLTYTHVCLILDEPTLDYGVLDSGSESVLRRL